MLKKKVLALFLCSLMVFSSPGALPALAAGAPTVATLAATSTVPTSATVTGRSSITVNLTGWGVVYGTDPNPTLETGTPLPPSDVSGGLFSVHIPGLSPSTTYHVRAYAANADGTGYGEDITFTTADGEYNWTDISANLPASAQGNTALGDMQFISDNEGWIANAMKPALYYTINGGRTFQELSGSLPMGIQGIHAIYFMNRNEGFIGGRNQHVYQTLDGGNAWYDLGTLGSTINDIDFASSASKVGFCCGESGVVKKISRSNQTGEIASMSSMAYTDEISANMLSVSAVSDDLAFASGTGTEMIRYDGTSWRILSDSPGESSNSLCMLDARNGFGAGSTGIIYKTDTGFEIENDRCFDEQTNPLRVSRPHTLTSMFALDTQNAWTAGSNGVVLHTNNGGITWNVEAEDMTSNMMRSVFFTSLTNGYALGNKGTLLKYGLIDSAPADGWARMEAPDDSQIYDGVFADGDQVWVAGDNSILHSPDYPDTPMTAQYENENMGFNDMCFRKSGGTILGWAVGSGPSGVRTVDAAAGTWSGMSMIGSGSAFAVHFPSDGVGYAVDYRNTFMKTADGGQTRFQLVTPAADDPVDGHSHKITFTAVNSLFFVDENTGYAATSDPEIRKTTDGGVHWDTEADGSYSDVYFVDADHGWAVGVSGILRYHEGTWEEQDYAYKNYFPLESVFFLNENEGWACGQGGVVIHTTDGGSNWTLQQTGVDADLLDIYFVSADLGYAVGNDGTLLRFVSSSPESEPDELSAVTDNITAITAISARVSGTAKPSSQYGIQERGVVYGRNANPTLDDIKVTYTADVSAGPILCNLTNLSPDTVYHVRAYALDYGGSLVYGVDKIFTTASGTAYGWVDISANLPANARLDPSLPDNAAGATTMSDLDFIDADTGWLTLMRAENNILIYELLITHDGGQTFQVSTIPTNFNGISFKNADEGLAAGQNGRVYRTLDGGLTWRNAGSGVSAYYDVTYPQGSDSGYACGYWMRLSRVKPVDPVSGLETGLETMAREEGIQGWSENLNCLSFVPSGDGWEGWAGGTEAIIHWDGTQWKADGSMPSSEVESGSHNGICMANPNQGWCVMDWGYILYTANGRDWTIQASPDRLSPGAHRTLLDVYFLNDQEGWAVGVQGVLLHTMDGGMSWNLEAQGMSNRMMTAVDFVSPSCGYALGNNGVLLKYTALTGQEVTVPGVTTGEVTNITTDSADVGGLVTSDGGAEVTERGIVYGTSADPTIQSAVKAEASAAGTGEFSVSINGLTPGTVYHVKAYATNSAGTAYGQDIQFTTEEDSIVILPTVTTAAVTIIKSSSATAGGVVISDGGGAISQRGMVYSTTAEPTIDNSVVYAQGTTGPFNVRLSGLTNGTVYHVRAFAVNAAGTAYGEDVSFKTASSAGGSGGGGSDSNPANGETVNKTTDPQVAAPASSDPIDIGGHWAHDCIITLIKHNVICGYPDKTIRPERQISRAEAACVIVSALGLKDNKPASLSDPYKDELPAWAERSIMIATEKGLMKGYGDGTFRAQQPITREEMFTVLVLAYGLKPLPEAGFNYTDKEMIAPWALASVKAAAANHIISGYPDGSLRPKQPISRAEVFTLVCRLCGFHNEHSSQK